MPKIKNVTGEDRTLPWLGDRLVLAGQVIDVADADVYAYTQQSSAWEAADDEAEAITDKLAKSTEIEAATPIPDNAPEPYASRTDWAAYALGKGIDPGTYTRDEIRDLFDGKPSPDAEVADEPDPNPRPSGNASRDDWAAYANAKGVDPTAYTRDEIRDLFDGKPSPTPEPTDEPDPNPRPPGNASRDDWAAYAVAKGVDPGARTRDEIRDLFEETK